MVDDNSLFPLATPPSSTTGIVALFESTCVHVVSSSEADVAVVVAAGVVAVSVEVVAVVVATVVAVVAGVVVESMFPIYRTSAMLVSFNAYGMAAKNSRILLYAPNSISLSLSADPPRMTRVVLPSTMKQPLALIFSGWPAMQMLAKEKKKEQSEGAIQRDESCDARGCHPQVAYTMSSGDESAATRICSRATRSIKDHSKGTQPGSW